LLPSIRCFDSQDGQECRPRRIRDGFGAVVIPDHVGRLHVLAIHAVVLPHEGERRLVLEVLPLALDLQMGCGKERDCLRAAMAALLPPGDAASTAPQIRLRVALGAGGVDHRASGQGSKGR
jgi:hypothetical protein